MRLNLKFGFFFSETKKKVQVNFGNRPKVWDLLEKVQGRFEIVSKVWSFFFIFWNWPVIVGIVWSFLWLFPLSLS